MILKTRQFIFAFTLLLLCVCLISCGKTDAESDILIRVNGEAIHYDDLTFAQKQYEGQNITDQTLIEGLIKERIVLQYFENLNKTISDEEIEAQFHALKGTSSEGFFYKKAKDGYGADENIKDAIRYRLMYNEVKEYVRSEFEKVYTINAEKLLFRTEEFISQHDVQSLNAAEQNDYKGAVMRQYEESLSSEISDLFFQTWLNEQVKCSRVDFVNWTSEAFPKARTIQFSNEALQIDGSDVVCKEMSLSEAQEVYGNFLYLPNEVSKYEKLLIQGIHNPKEQLKALLISYFDKIHNTSVSINVIVSPNLVIDKNSTEVVNDGVRTVEQVFADIGVRYSISSALDSKTLKELLYEKIPFSKE